MRVRCWSALAVLAACSVPELDLTGRPCPCADGWTCDERLQVCLREGFVLLTVDVAGGGEVRFPDGTTCRDTVCARSYLRGTGVSLEPVTDTGYRFAGWEPSTCAGPLQLDGSLRCAARFVPDAPALAQVTVLNSPMDIAAWAEAATVTLLDLAPTGVHIEFSKRDGPGSWPEAPASATQYTLWIVLKVGGAWYTTGCIGFERGTDRTGGPLTEYATNWYYDAARWAPMTGHQPQPGELVGFFVSAGNARNVLDHSGTSVLERSNVVWIAFPDASGAVFTF
jgi:hypothetical protein